MNPLGLFLEPPGPLFTHLHTVCMAYSERLPTRLNPLAERTCFSQVGEMQPPTLGSARPPHGGRPRSCTTASVPDPDPGTPELTPEKGSSDPNLALACPKVGSRIPTHPDPIPTHPDPVPTLFRPKMGSSRPYSGLGHPTPEKIVPTSEIETLLRFASATVIA